MIMEIEVHDIVKDEDGGYRTECYIERRDIPDDQVREEDICTICGFPDYPNCKRTCHNFRDKENE